MDKSKFYLDLSKCTEEERKHIKTLTGIKNDSERIYLSFSPIQNVWGYFNSIGIKNKTGLTYPDFIKLFEGGESKEVLQVEKSKASNFILGQIDKKIEQINEIDIAHTEGVLIGLKICKEMWAQGTISHENIQQEIHYYQEELDYLNSK